MGAAPSDTPSLDEDIRRLGWFAEYTERLDAQRPDLPLRCRCCGCRTLAERGGFENCQVCLWEYDGQDGYKADVVRGGPMLSLSQARANYLRWGASTESMVRNVRPPVPEELSG